MCYEGTKTKDTCDDFFKFNVDVNYEHPCKFI